MATIGTEITLASGVAFDVSETPEEVGNAVCNGDTWVCFHVLSEYGDEAWDGHAQAFRSDHIVAFIANLSED